MILYYSLGKPWEGINNASNQINHTVFNEKSLFVEGKNIYPDSNNNSEEWINLIHLCFYLSEKVHYFLWKQYHIKKTINFIMPLMILSIGKALSVSGLYSFVK